MVRQSASGSNRISDGIGFMTELFSDIQFAHPLFLWLLIGLPLLWLRVRDHRVLVIVGRTVIFLLLIFGLADPQTVSQQAKQQEGRIFAFDLSESIPASMRRGMEQVAQGEFAASGRGRVFVFASEAAEAPNWRVWLAKSGVPQETIHPAKTSLEKLFTRLLALAAAPRNVFLFTDGWETQGSVEQLLPAIAASGLKIFPLVPT